VIAGRPQQAVHAGGNDRQPACGAFLFADWMLFLTPSQQCQTLKTMQKKHAEMQKNAKLSRRNILSWKKYFFHIFVRTDRGLYGTETVQVTPLRRTLASSPQSECASCLQCFDTGGWAAGTASGP